MKTDWKLKTMWEPTSGVNRIFLKISSNLKIMFYGFPKEKKNASRKIQEKMVWSI